MAGRPKRQRLQIRNGSELRRNRQSNYLLRTNMIPQGEVFPFRTPLNSETSVLYHDLGLLSEKCTFCNALHFKAEFINGHYSLCCHKGLVLFPEPDVNPDLKVLSLEDKNFVDYIRNYNSAMAFASLSATKKDIPGVGPYCFKVQGQIYRYISDILPLNETEPSFGQLYIIDSSTANSIRNGRNENKTLKRSTLDKLSTILNNNPYAVSFQKAGNIFSLENNSGRSIDLRFVDHVSLDQRRYNKPSSDEIAGVFISESGEPPPNRHVVIYGRAGGPRLLSTYSPHCDPMLYPILFPFGEPGWDKELTHNGIRRQNTRTRMTLLQFVNYKLGIRSNFSHLHHGKKLFQQYLVDQFTRVEAQRLEYLRKNQKALRVDQFSGLQDFVNLQAQERNCVAGRMVILPSTFQGSPRNMAQRYLDAMSIVRKFGKPDIFLTFTCNPNWLEIQKSLSPCETTADRPDIVNRVFHLKLKELKTDLFKKHVLGRVCAYTYVIEFQKRGLPHCHFLIILENNSKFREPEDIDLIVTAELPDSNNFPQLFEIVLARMVHGPCGVRNPNSPCMKDGKCSKNYPKEFCENTRGNNNGYPIYRRRYDGRKALKQGFEIDNRDIVPYNKYLCLKYDAHINVEVCSSVKSVKYLYKYIYKGFDAASMSFVTTEQNVEARYDEITSFVNMRYISAHEATWRLFEYEMQEQSHTIVRLAVHEAQKQLVYFQAGNESAALLNAPAKLTSLLAWFELNQNDPNAKQFLYTEIPNYYTFKNNKWERRIREGSSVIGRLYAVPPNDQERYFLRILLLHVKGATSYKDLKTVGNIECSTFREAALKRGLIENDDEWRACMEEMSEIHMPKQLRRLFAYICCFCEPAQPLSLWVMFKEQMIEDLIRNYSENEAIDIALSELETIFCDNGLSCMNLGLPTPSGNVEVFNNNNSNERQILAERMYVNMNEEQRLVVDHIILSVNREISNKIFFLEAPGGCGKTYVYSYLINKLRGNDKIVLAAAWTGIAALLLDEGKTVHKTFGLPVPITDISVSSIKANSQRANVLRQANLILIDEASMIPALAINCIDRLLKDITQSNDAMGGKVIVFGGDFRQILPVVFHGDRAKIVESCIQNSIIWPKVTILRLRKNMRSDPNQLNFSNWLLKLGNNEVPNKLSEEIIKIPDEFICTGSIINHVFGEMIHDFNNIDSKIIMCPLNESCFKINEEVLKLIDGPEKSYYSVDSVISDTTDNIILPTEYINSLTPQGLPLHCLKVKKGAVVILIRNMNISFGLVNGTRLIVRDMLENCLKLEIVTGNSAGKFVFLPRIELICTDVNMPFTLKRKQFPVRLAFAMTINKAQGQTFEKVGIYLPQSVFTHGQLYVAFSRARSANDIRVQIDQTNLQGQFEQHEGYFTKNIVYREVLR